MEDMGIVAKMKCVREPGAAVLLEAFLFQKKRTSFRKKKEFQLLGGGNDGEEPRLRQMKISMTRVKNSSLFFFFFFYLWSTQINVSITYHAIHCSGS